MATTANGRDGSQDIERAIGQRLDVLSEHVRAVRARRGMTRKDLSRHSGISERYLAQLENDGANVSIALLWRIAAAMGIGLHELLPDSPAAPVRFPPLLDLLERLSPEEEELAYKLLSEQFPVRRGPHTGVALVGMRGAGKSTLGERLASACGVPFIRLGDVIERLGGMELGELFSLGGQPAYRRLERQAVQHVIDHDPRSVLETGGSLVSEHDTFNLLGSAFYTVWVKASPEEHMQRVVSQGDMRPMQGSEAAMDDLRRILAEREPYYRAANAVLDTSGRGIEDCVEELFDTGRPILSVIGS